MPGGCDDWSMYEGCDDGCDVDGVTHGEGDDNEHDDDDDDDDDYTDDDDDGDGNDDDDGVDDDDDGDSDGDADEASLFGLVCVSLRPQAKHSTVTRTSGLA